MSTRKIDDLLNEGHRRFSPLQRLLRRSSDQKAWTAQLRAFIDPPLRYEVEILQIQGRVMTILCQSAGAATRMRFMLPELRTKLATLDAFNGVEEINLRVSSSSRS